MVVAAGADDIDGALRRAYLVHFGAQRPGAAGQLLGGLATHLQAHQEGAHLGRGGVARGHDVEGALGLVDGQGLAVAHLGQKAAKIVDVAAHFVLIFASCRSAQGAGSYITWLKNSSSRSPAWIATAASKPSPVPPRAPEPRPSRSISKAARCACRRTPTCRRSPRQSSARVSGSLRKVDWRA